MVSIKGRSVFGSIARGKLTFYHRDEFIINKIKVSDPELEYKKYVKAKNAALVELGELYDRARLSVGEGDAQIFVIHQMLITDEQYDSSIRTKILDEHFNADYAVASTSRSFAEMLAQMDSEYMQSRAADVKDVSNRLLRHILNCADKLTILKENAIIDISFMSYSAEVISPPCTATSAWFISSRSPDFDEANSLSEVV